MGAAHLLRCSDQTNRLTPHPGPLPIGWGEGESPAVSPRSWRRKSSNDPVLAIAESTAPPNTLSPSEGERAGVRGRGKLKIENYQLPIFNLRRHGTRSSPWRKRAEVKGYCAHGCKDFEMRPTAIDRSRFERVPSAQVHRERLTTAQERFDTIQPGPDMKNLTLTLGTFLVLATQQAVL